MLFYRPAIISSLNRSLTFPLPSFFHHNVGLVIDRTNHRIMPQVSDPINFFKSDIVLYFCKILIGCYAQDFSESVLLMNDHLTKDAPQATLLQPDDPRL